MKLTGPFRYHIEFTVTSITRVEGDGRQLGFSGPTAHRGPKLYVVSDRDAPVYVGVTRQSMMQRLRSGFSANGSHGYHGYLFRNYLSRATLDVWLQENPAESADQVDMETVEAELVLLVRQKTGQWPKYQTEIHFHQSLRIHREIAEAVARHYPVMRLKSSPGS